MNKIMVAVLVIAIAVTGIWYLNNMDSNKSYKQVKKVVVTNNSGVKIVNDELILSLHEKQVSMVDLKIGSVGGDMGKFEVNKEVFNSELLNQIEENGELHVVLGVMKSTSDLPKGEVMVGKVVGATGTLFAKGKITVSSSSGADPIEETVETGGSETK